MTEPVFTATVKATASTLAVETGTLLAGAGVLRTAVTIGARLGDVFPVDTDMTTTLVQLPDLTASVALLTAARKRSFLDQLNEPGKGELTLQNDDDQPELGDLIRFSVKGEAAWTMICEERERVSTADGEEAEQATKWSGRGHLALMERALVYPSGGTGRLPIEEDRLFSWPALDFDDSGWPPAAQMLPLGYAKVVWGSTVGSAVDPNFPDNSAFFIWSPLGSFTNAPDGTCYFRREFTFPSTGPAVIYWIADNTGELFLDGAKILSVEAQGGFTRMAKINIEALSSGTHLLAAWVRNFVQATNNPGGLAVSLYSADQSGEPIALVEHTTSAWKLLGYPASVPGMTPGQAIRILVEEAQTRGAIPYVTLAFSDSADSAGDPWPVIGDIATKVGSDLLTVLRELSGTYIDVWMPPATTELYAWNIAGRGSARAADYHAPTDPLDPATANVTGLVHLGRY